MMAFSLRPKYVEFEPAWKGILETIKCVVTCGTVPKATWNERFSDVYGLCVSCPDSHGDRLYAETKEFLEKHVKDLHAIVAECCDETLLKTYHNHWVEYSEGSAYLSLLYSYMSSTFIKKQKFSEADLNYGGFTLEKGENMLEVGQLALETWNNILIEPLQAQLLALSLYEIQRDRSGDDVNQTVVHGVIHSFVHVEKHKKKYPLQFYEELFEEEFLDETGRYYRKEASKLKSQYSCSEYMEKVIQRLDSEDFRSRKFIHPSSYTKVTRECQHRMVADHLQFLYGECEEMVKLEIRKDLSNMYTLLKPINGGLPVLVKQVENHIKATASDTVKNLKGENIPTQFVESMLDVHGKFTELIQSVFQGDKLFVGALDMACAAAINYKPNPKQTSKSPELLAKYCDSLLKKSSKGVSESELDDKLASCITVFKYLDDKDVFQRFYSRLLAKRLIHNLATSMDSEESMINKLKQACGYEFTNKLHRMFTDMTISSDLNNKFSDYIRTNNIELGFNFTILVLQAGAWPISQSNLPTFALPHQLEKSVQMFEIFYNKNFNGRKLTWMHSFCTVELKFSYLKKPYFVTMGTFPMSLLMLFNNSEKVSFREMKDASQLPEKELQKQIQSLLDSKIVSLEGALNEYSVVRLNMSYTNKRTKFKITPASQKDTPQEIEQSHTAIEEDRKIYLQAAIVRTMKARKVLKHNLLIQEVISQSQARFSPNVPLIKKCIEMLIDKQYLERTPTAADEYSYIA